MKKFLESVWTGIKWIAQQIWAPFSDRQWHADPYKIGGFACFVVATILAFKVFDMVMKVDAGTLGILAGLVGTIIGVGTFLFNQSRKSDDTLGK